MDTVNKSDETRTNLSYEIKLSLKTTSRYNRQAKRIGTAMLDDSARGCFHRSQALETSGDHQEPTSY